jgi:hypothetical protein
MKIRLRPLRGDNCAIKHAFLHIAMAIAIKKPFTSETQALRDSVDLSEEDHEEIPCGRCDAVYILVYLKSSTPEQRTQYRRAVQQSIGNCDHHPPWINLPF